jgi:hypothetical protein
MPTGKVHNWREMRSKSIAIGGAILMKELQLCKRDGINWYGRCTDDDNVVKASEISGA